MEPSGDSHYSSDDDKTQEIHVSQTQTSVEHDSGWEPTQHNPLALGVFTELQLPKPLPTETQVQRAENIVVNQTRGNSRTTQMRADQMLLPYVADHSSSSQHYPPLVAEVVPSRPARPKVAGPSKPRGQRDDGDKAPRRKRKKSTVWQSFDKVFERQRDGSSKTFAQCKRCGKKLTGHSSGGTNHLWYHAAHCPGLQEEAAAPAESVDETTGNGMAPDVVVTGFQYDDARQRESLARFICACGLDLDFADNPHWEEYIRTSFYPEYRRPSRETTRADIEKLYEGGRTALIGQFAEDNQRFAFTSDIWLSEAGIDYVSVCGHYISSEWKIEKRLIGFRPLDVGHTGENIASQILAVLNDYGVSGRVISITLCDAASNDETVEILQNELNPIADGFFFHQQCVTHILNLIVQDGLRVLGGSLNVIRDAIKWLNGSYQREARWRQTCRLNNVPPKGLATDLPVWWNSTYFMLQSVLPYSRVFQLWYNGERNDNLLTERHWEEARCLCRFLEVFYKATNTFSTCSLATATLVVHELVEISEAFKEYKFHTRLGDAILAMLSKFLKYFHPLPRLYAFALLLDPRCRYRGLRTFLDLLTKQLSVDYNQYLEGYKNSLQEAYRKYELQFGKASEYVSQEQTSSERKSWALYHAHQATQESSSSSMSLASSSDNNELNVFFDTYFKGTRSNNLDLLKWWKDHQSTFPVLSILACDILSVPVSAISSESAFSMCGNILNPNRSHLTPRMVEILMLAKDWELARMKRQNTHEYENDELAERFDNWSIQ